MMNYAVIGANFGDEGKGLATDYFVHKTRRSIPLVARGNGGAQAGHTVETKDGKRHVFGHIGAGAFAGADTYLTRQFIINPYTLGKEMARLEELGVDVSQKIFAHPHCRVTIIYDMALNALRELSRGKNRHGSCGLGINETVNRCLAGHTITLQDAQTSSIFRLSQQFKHIFQVYWEKEYMALKDKVDKEEAAPFLALFNSPNFEHDAKALFALKMISTAYEQQDVSLIIEGAQGLMLDEHMGIFPYVTRSNTGLPSAIMAAYELFYQELTPVYITRAYFTRHGAGPLQMENVSICDNQLYDKTNVLGPWQGHLRYAPLDIGATTMMIMRDLHRSRGLSRLMGVTVHKPELMITCLDQVGETLNVNVGGKLVNIATENLPHLLQEHLPEVKVKYLSYGPTAEDVKEI